MPQTGCLLSSWARPVLALLPLFICPGVQSTSTWKPLTLEKLPLQVGDAEALVQWGEAAVEKQLPVTSTAPGLSLPISLSAQAAPKRRRAKRKTLGGKKHRKRKRHKSKQHHKHLTKGKASKVGLARTASLTVRDGQRASASSVIERSLHSLREVHRQQPSSSDSNATNLRPAISQRKMREENPESKKRISSVINIRGSKSSRSTSLTAAKTGTRLLLPWKQWVAAAGGNIPGEIVQDELKIQQLEHTNDRLAAGYKNLDKEFKQSEYSQERINERFNQDQAHIAQQQSLMQTGFQETAKEENVYNILSSKVQDLNKQLMTEDRGIDKIQQVVEYKANTEGVLRGQLQQLKQELIDDQTRESTMDHRVEQQLRNGTKMLKSSKVTGHALAKELNKLQFRLNSTANDKDNLKEQRRKLENENQRLTMQGTKIESLRRQQQAEKDALQHELENSQQERADLQHELDILEANNSTSSVTKADMNVETDAEEGDEAADAGMKTQDNIKTMVGLKATAKTQSPKVAKLQATESAKQLADDDDADEDAKVDDALEADVVADNGPAGAERKDAVAALQTQKQSKANKSPNPKLVAIEDLDY